MKPDFVSRLAPVRSGAAQELQRQGVVALGAKLAKEPRGYLDIVVQNVGPGLENSLQGGPVSLQVGDQDFHPAVRDLLAQKLYAAGKERRASVRKIVSRHGGDDDVAQPHRPYCLNEAFGFRLVDRAGPPVRDVAIPAVAGTGVPQDEKGGRAGPEALPHVGAAGFLADGVEIQSAEKPPHLGELAGVRQGDFQPVGFSLESWGFRIQASGFGIGKKNLFSRNPDS